MAQESGDHGFLTFYSFFHVKACRDSEKKEENLTNHWTCQSTFHGRMNIRGAITLQKN